MTETPATGVPHPPGAPDPNRRVSLPAQVAGLKARPEFSKSSAAWKRRPAERGPGPGATGARQISGPVRWSHIVSEGSVIRGRVKRGDPSPDPAAGGMPPAKNQARDKRPVRKAHPCPPNAIGGETCTVSGPRAQPVSIDRHPDPRRLTRAYSAPRTHGGEGRTHPPRPATRGRPPTWSPRPQPEGVAPRSSGGGESSTGVLQKLNRLETAASGAWTWPRRNRRTADRKAGAFDARRRWWGCHPGLGQARRSHPRPSGGRNAPCKGRWARQAART
ncbi:hypothetical protein SAMN05421803_11623 [Nocardiopsis flavescens]|uniref:Uncharacterized protein n=1 Tax=Nocardiopsis flavescens TaxID=758803 RepID=A0A1M6QU53_9ACTN|nr:hypothetical protein SAMN05421803_11623 [Nocardiopsis flavescens]